MYKSFAGFITKTAQSMHIRENFLIGVVTGVITSQFGNITERSCNAQATTAAAVNDERRVQLYGRGIIGVNMVCFLVNCDKRASIYKISRAITVFRADERRFKMSRKFLKSSRGRKKLLWISRRGEHLFAACHVTDANDQSLDSDTRMQFIRLTTEMRSNAQ